MRFKSEVLAAQFHILWLFHTINVYQIHFFILFHVARFNYDVAIDDYHVGHCGFKIQLVIRAKLSIMMIRIIILKKLLSNFLRELIL